MMIEIGSEFWTGSTPASGNGVIEILPPEMNVLYTLCGRTALELLIRDALRDQIINRAYLPSYCCHTMIEPFRSKGIDVEFYDVFFSDSGIECDFRENHECQMVFLMDYFGFRDDKTALRAKRQKKMGKCVVYDATHAMFCQNMDYSAYDYVFGSFRKWFGVNAGFCAKNGIWKEYPKLKQNARYTNTRNHAFMEKQRFMAGEIAEKDSFLREFSSSEQYLEKNYIGYGPDKVSLDTLQTVDVDFIRRKRRENASFVIDSFRSMNLKAVKSPYKQVQEDDCPLFVPLAVDSAVRMNLRQMLIQNQIYLPVHWPLSELHKIGSVAYRVYDTELSLVCDQRYELEDMKRVIEKIRSY